MAGPKFNPDPVGLPTFRSQHPLRAEDLRIIARQSRQMMLSANTGGISDTGGDVGFQVGDELLPEGFFARLTAPPISTSQPFFDFIEVQDAGDGITWIPPNGVFVSHGTAYEGNGYVNIDVPTAPQQLQADSTPGTDFWYTVTAIWKNVRGNEFQGPWSNEVGIAGNGTTLTWLKPLPFSLDTGPETWPRSSVPRWAVTGYQIWGGPGPVSGQEAYLLGTVDQNTFSFTHDGSLGVAKTPVPGGGAGPVVWMSPFTTWGYFKFFYPADPLVQAWVKVTSATGQTVKLAGGGSLTLYPAVLDRFSDSSADWSDGLTTQWFRDINGSVPIADTRYLCRLLAMDHDGNPVWAGAAVEKSSRTCVLGPFITNIVCQNDQLIITQKWLCIPNDDICQAYFVDSPGQCPVTN